MGDSQELSSAVVDSVSLERALKDVEVANLRAMQLSKEVLDCNETIAKLEEQIVALKRAMDPRRRLEHVFRSNHTLYVAARRAKRMLGR